ncbi:Rec8 like protein-domain-containing protein [Rhodocollybia butyracea]|uniref:Rec8 like protein-domain-containing protein n=1 Tax=Rhodocollybia butyracea TaxID=206335 RepID=A0A9P5UDI8_9AGAR|nr:Rec8 like protein-domain-containing protein [Rhodocollybia butyracea]
MFFSPELFARRDSGIGLLWLASTLSSKASYKKISKRTALTADISQLCELITQPKEPLALRLSSNLMIGVARVYKIKQDIFMTDVNSCVSSLKKVVQDVQNAATKDAHQMVQPQARPSAFTLAADPEVMYFIEFDDLVADWDEFLNLENIEQGQEEDEDEDEDDPEFNASRAKKSKQKANAKPPPLTEEVRADMVTLKEHHDHLLSNSFDLSFQGQPRSAADASSSQPEPAFGLDLFPDMDEVIDFGLGDDLARELGEGWGVSPVKNPIQDRMDVDGPLDPIPFEDRGMGIDDDFMLGGDANFGDDMLQGFGEHAHNRLPSVEPPMQTPVQRKTTKGEENPPLNFQAPVAPSQKPPSPANSFAQQLLSQDEDLFQPVSRPLADVTMNHQNNTNKAQPKKTLKRTRLLLDVRTELTEEETKIARAQYLADQYSQRRQFRSKIREKYSEKLVGDLIWGVPAGIEAPALIDFWQDNFKVQVEARTGQIYLDKPGMDDIHRSIAVVTDKRLP